MNVVLKINFEDHVLRFEDHFLNSRSSKRSSKVHKSLPALRFRQKRKCPLAVLKTRSRHLSVQSWSSLLKSVEKTVSRSKSGELSGDARRCRSVATQD